MKQPGKNNNNPDSGFGSVGTHFVHRTSLGSLVSPLPAGPPCRNHITKLPRRMNERSNWSFKSRIIHFQAAGKEVVGGSLLCQLWISIDQLAFRDVFYISCHFSYILLTLYTTTLLNICVSSSFFLHRKGLSIIHLHSGQETRSPINRDETFEWWYVGQGA